MPTSSLADPPVWQLGFSRFLVAVPGVQPV